MKIKEYELTEEVRSKYKPIIENYIRESEKNSNSITVLELINSGLNPYTLWKLLEELGYEQCEVENSNWQMDFSVIFTSDKLRDITLMFTIQKSKVIY